MKNNSARNLHFESLIKTAVIAPPPATKKVYGRPPITQTEVTALRNKIMAMSSQLEKKATNLTARISAAIPLELKNETADLSKEREALEHLKRVLQAKTTWFRRQQKRSA